ncbi:DUF4307 domain-containing protein [Aquipuribacter sp. MA13-6]|uniref:DUF4307 domain-containing protein n=1 Tax=unclassified Aquipuribacter TaxID=2635084 RepID=UPI003EEB694B
MSTSAGGGGTTARAQQAGDDVSARYARPQRPWLTRTLAVLGVVAAVGAFALVVTSLLDDGVRFRDVSFAVVDEDLVQVRFEVYADEGDLVRCQVRAADARYGDVGQVDVDLGPLPPGGGEGATVDVRTVAPAASASVRACVRLE